jgi:hypothetical protein
MSGKFNSLFAKITVMKMYEKNENAKKWIFFIKLVVILTFRSQENEFFL